MRELKKNILEYTKENQTAYSRLERLAGLPQNFISNVLYNKSKNPGIESIIKLADALDTSIDTLVGRKKRNANLPGEIVIENKTMFKEIVLLILQYTENHMSKISSTELFKAITNIYSYSIDKNKVDKEFINWYLKTHVLK